MKKHTYQIRAVGIGVVLASILLGLLAFPTEAFVPQWETTGAMGTARQACTATLLPDGRVLVAGGYNGSTPHTFYASAELYDPAAGTWQSTGSMTSGRAGHKAMLLPDGKVLVSGGYNGAYLASAELYDPAANGGLGAWTPAGSMSDSRVWHTMTLLPNGKVLATGGEDGSATFSTSSADLYDPAANGGLGAWSPTGSMAQHRGAHVATLLPDGKVLVAGGLWYEPGIGFGTVDLAEIYDPSAGTWLPTSSMRNRRHHHTATLLPNGTVLVTGGGIYGSGSHLAAELFDSDAGTWTNTGSMSTARGQHTATLLSNGHVLVAGGLGGGGALSSAERYDPAANGGLGAWSAAGSMAQSRFEHSAVLLLNGRVLEVGGGYSGTAPRSSAELHAPVSDGPFLGSIAQQFAKPGAIVTLRGYNFEDTQEGSTVTFNGVDAGLALSWIDGEISIGVPTGAGSGPVAITVGGETSNGLFLQVIQVCDFEGDGRTEITVWRPGDGIWWIKNSSDSGVAVTQWGSSAVNDVPVPGDYDGDGMTDVAVWRSSDGNWWIKKSSDSGVTVTQWGASTDKVVPADYDGDGTMDVAVWRPGDGNWWIKKSSDSGVTVTQWGSGAVNDVPVPGDYDGDGTTDVAVWRPGDGNWWIKRSSDSGVTVTQWGSGAVNDVPVPGDYDGDGTTDVAVWRPGDGTWWIKKSSDSGVTVTQWGSGAVNDIPVPGDYDGDGTTDVAVWRPGDGTWWIKKTSDSGVTVTQWGMIGDQPVNRPVHLWGSP